jgi:gluconate 2-dehydrogenase gamma chain
MYNVAVSQPDPALPLAAGELATLAAVVDRLIPADELGPGGSDCGVVRYIERGLEEAFPGDRPAYQTGLAALDAHALALTGAPFATLAPALRDELLAQAEAGKAEWLPDGAAFFERVREHAIQGMFGDPRHGGNADCAGWQLVGYPGPRLEVEPADERLDEPTRIEWRSIAEHGIFDLADERPSP